MEILTYSLKDEASTSDGFYRAADRFADEVLGHARSPLAPAAEDYVRWVRRTGSEPERSVSEYAFELLTLGVLWRIYTASAGSMKPWQGRLLRRLVSLRTASPRLKPATDRIRSTLGSRWLAPATPVRSPHGGEADNSPPTMAGLDRLLLWLEATGEFRQEAERFRRWRLYIRELAESRASGLIKLALEEARWFETAAEEALGQYTRRVDHFRILRRKSYRPRDSVLGNRRRAEYHLNLVGAEIMNRAYRSEYKKTDKRAVLLPACLKSPGSLGCAAVLNGTPFRCVSCAPECRIGQINAMGWQDGFEVWIAPHESDAFSREAVDRLLRDKTGIVGVACALNLISGGWRSKALGIPAQCVVLDYCGCRDHWDELGFSTDLNLDRLRQLLELKPHTP